MSNNRAFVTGINGQDGSFLTELLLEKDYEIHGLIFEEDKKLLSIDHLCNDSNIINKRLFLHYGNLLDEEGLISIIKEISPNEIYNLAAQSQVSLSFEQPILTSDVNGLGVLRILEAVKKSGIEKECKMFQASTADLYGKVVETPQTELTEFRPHSPYAIAKLFAHLMIKHYRDVQGFFACNGIMFSHESERRGHNFVTRKIVTALCKIKLGMQDVLELGNMDSKRDWGYAKDYVEAMWLMLQQEKPDDYVIATGKTHTVREFVELTCKKLGFEIVWEGKGVDEIGKDKKTGKVLVRINPRYFRPTDVDLLLGNPSKAERELGWKAKTSLEELVDIMVESDLEKLERDGHANFF
ncbi:MAG: GDP-mannose 4,6-dehydratase [Candidatus Dojkabacteria bacterium]